MGTVEVWGAAAAPERLQAPVGCCGTVWEERGMAMGRETWTCAV
jgi:hypothetical protein